MSTYLTLTNHVSTHLLVVVLPPSALSLTSLTMKQTHPNAQIWDLQDKDVELQTVSATTSPEEEYALFGALQHRR